MAQVQVSRSDDMNDLDLGEYRTSYQTEVITLTWRLDDFSKFMEMFGDQNPSIQFSAGQSLGIPSTWKLEIVIGDTLYDDDERIDDDPSNYNEFPDDVKPRSLRLSLVGGEGVQPKYFNCEVTIKDKDDPTKNHLSFTLLCKDSDMMNSQHNIGCVDSLNKKALIGDELVIHVKFTLAADKVAVPDGVNSKELIETSRKEVINNLDSLLESGYGSDFVIKVKGKDGRIVEMKAHKNILWSRSPVFQRMLDSEMRERGSGEMVITDLSPVTVKILLKWMYTGSLDDGWKTVPEEMVNAANKYEPPLLLQFLDRNLHTICEMDNALQLGTLAKLHGLAFATKKIAEFVKANVEVFFQ